MGGERDLPDEEIEDRLRRLPEVLAFVEAARAYVAWIEAAPRPPREEALVALRLLARLYAAGHGLPLEPPIIERQARDRRPSHGDWQRFFHRCAGLPVQYYRCDWEPWILDGPNPGDDDRSVGDLHDDCADVACDILEGLRDWDAGDFAEAVWNWSDGLRNHWGRHAADAIAVLQKWLEEDGDPWPDPGP